MAKRSRPKDTGPILTDHMAASLGHDLAKLRPSNADAWYAINGWIAQQSSFYRRRASRVRLQIWAAFKAERAALDPDR